MKLIKNSIHNISLVNSKTSTSNKKENLSQQNRAFAKFAVEKDSTVKVKGGLTVADLQGL